MALPDSGKLVRDKIPQIIRSSGRQPQVVTVEHGDMRAALEMKLYEEVDELLVSPEDSRLEELADIYEVVIALARDIEATEHQLHEAALRKRSERGAFNDRTWLVNRGDE